MRNLLLLIVMCAWSVCASAAPGDYMFKHLEVKNGLSNNQVNAIYRDSHGFMWFGTASGLNRYDGYDIKIYRRQQDDAESLPDSHIENIQEDISGNLWIRTSKGYAVYNSEADVFDRNVGIWMRDIGISGIPAIVYIDKDKTWWIYVSGKGVYRYKSDEKSADTTGLPVKMLSETDVTDMTECGEGIVLACNNGTLVCLDKEKLNVKWINKDIVSESGKVENNTFSLFVDRDDKVWIYSVVGLWVYQLRTKQWTVRSPRHDACDIVRVLAQDKYGHIWIGHDQDGIEVIDEGRKYIRLSNAPGNERTLSNNTITALYEDAAGTMWVGTYKKGISYYNESAFKFGIADVGDINCVEDGKNDIVWLGTNGSGLIRWNRSTGERKVYSHTADANSVSSDVIVSLLQASDGKLWIGTYWGGLNSFDGKRFVHYRNNEHENSSSVYDNIWALVEDKEKNIWIGTLGGGVQCLNPKTGVFTTYSTANSGLVSDYVGSLCIGRDNKLIIGTSSGMAVMDMSTRKITHFTGTRSGKAQFSNQTFTQVYEDSRGLIWAATREGLNVYAPKQDELYEVPIKPDFSKLYILGIAEDERRSIWVSTGGELINIVLLDDGKSGKLAFRCYAYNDKDGLQSCDFNQRSLKRLHTGEIVIGGMYGLNHFRPDNIKYNTVLPKVMFTGFQLFNEEVKVGRKYAGRVILKKALNNSREIVLNYKQNVFTVFFAADNYILPDKAQYLYKLEGFNDNWMTGTGDVHRVTYTNLAPGTYTLKVKAINSDGYEGREEANLKIVIVPPFWLTTWAFVAYFLIILGVLFIAWNTILGRERNKFKIQQIKREAERNEEINQMKFRFFTNISHELRTPLTLIISPLESIIKDAKDTVLQNQLEMMHRNAAKLLNLVNQLLDFRKNEVVGLHLNLSEGEIISFVQNVCNSFLDLSEKRSVHLTFFSAIKSLNMSFDEDKIAKMMMNLLSNAFKFTPDGGRVDVSLELIKGDTETLEIKVSDTGTGISDEDKERIFERFYQIDRNGDANRSTGSGIGLSLVRDYVTLHGGTVRVFDNIGSGSVFVIDIPVKHSIVNVATPLSKEATEEDSVVLISAGTTVAEPADNIREEVPDKLQEEPKSNDKHKPLVLIVDDNADFLSFMNQALGLYFRVHTASDGMEAWQLIPDLMPDIIVSDLMMPEMDGNELCRQVKGDKRTGTIPFILLTARQSVENKVEGLTLGADDYVTKPFNMEVLILRMRKLIDLSSKNKLRGRIDPEPSEIVITSLDEKLIENAIKYVEKNISRPDLSVEELSHHLGMNRVYLYKKLLQITGKTPIEFIRIIRLKRATQLLRESQCNVSEVAYQIGFNNPKYFSKYFKEEFGVLPSVYQKKEGK